MDGGAVTGEPSRDACREWRGDLAMRSAGRVDAHRADGLQAHLDGCEQCRAELVDLESLAVALRAADPSHLGARKGAPAGLSERIVVAVSADSARRRRRHLTRAVVGVAAAMIVAVGAVAVLSRGDDPPRSAQRVELEGEHGASGRADLVERPWGTEVALAVSGLSEGETYWLWLTGDDGVRVGAGTFIGVGEHLDAVLAAGLPTDSARRIWVTDEDDVVVLDALVDPR